MLHTVQTLGQSFNQVAKLQDVEAQLMATLSHEVVRLLEVSQESRVVIEKSGLSQRDFVWFDKSNIAYKLSEIYIDWPAIIEDRNLERLYHVISYMKASIQFGAVLKPAQLHLV